MKVAVLSKTDQELTGANIAVALDFNDIAASTSGAAIALFTAPVGTKVQCVGYRLETAFDVSGTGALAVTIGDSGSATRLCASAVLAVDGTEVFYHVGGNPYVYLSELAVNAYATDATSMAYTAGKVIYYFSVNDMTKWAKVSL